jgi:hypothetical protein
MRLALLMPRTYDREEELERREGKEARRKVAEEKRRADMRKEQGSAGRGAKGVFDPLGRLTRPPSGIAIQTLRRELLYKLCVDPPHTRSRGAQVKRPPSARRKSICEGLRRWMISRVAGRQGVQRRFRPDRAQMS